MTSDTQWFEAIKVVLDADPEMAVVGRHFDAAIAFTFDDDRHDLVFHGGRIVEVRHAQRIDSRVDFGFRAPREVWRKFLQPYPPPLYHSVFALLMRVPEFHLDGDSLKFAQNARAVHRVLAVMQAAGAPA